MNENVIQKKIMEATKRVVSEKKISGTSIRIIAKEAKVLSSHVQYYYKTKQELLSALLKSTFQTFVDDRNAMLDNDFIDLPDKLGAIFQLKKNNISDNMTESILFDFWIQGMIDEAINKRFDDAYNKWREDIRKILIEFLPDIDPTMLEYIPYVMVSMMQGATMQHYINSSLDLDTYFSICIDVILNKVISPSTSDKAL